MVFVEAAEASDLLPVATNFGFCILPCLSAPRTQELLNVRILSQDTLASIPDVQLFLFLWQAAFFFYSNLLDVIIFCL